MRSLIVGASGHLGAHLARVLLEAGHEVRALVRPTSDLRGLVGLEVERVHGDVLDPASLDRAAAGREAVFHLAAPTSDGPGVAEAIEEGTRNVLEACRRAEVPRVVYTSSIATVGYSPSPAIVLDEATNDLSRATPYHEAKWRAERAALAFARQAGLSLVVVNPATVVGSLDHRVTPSNAPIQQCLERGLPVSFDAGVTVVHAEDVARGHLAALERGRSGERYILGGERLEIPDYFRLISRLCGRRPPLVRLPRQAMLGLGLGFSVARRLGWSRVPFTYRRATDLVGRYGWYSSEKAASELAYRWRPAEEAIADYVRWRRETPRDVGQA